MEAASVKVLEAEGQLLLPELDLQDKQTFKKCCGRQRLEPLQAVEEFGQQLVPKHVGLLGCCCSTL
jgi:hypothetical protein